MRRLLIYISLLISFSAHAQSEIVTDFTPVCDSLASLIAGRTGVQGNLSIKSIMKRGSALDFYFTESLGDFPWKEGDPRWFRHTLNDLVPEKYRKYKVGEIYSRGLALNNLVTSRLGHDGKPSSFRHRVRQTHESPAVVTELSTRKIKKGLQGRHITLWQSHGRYYAHSLDRWTWQRPCLFQTCEDMFTQSFVLPFLVPMLENSGAYVMLPRERDTQVNEVIVDNDSSWTSGPVIDVAGWAGAVRGIGKYSEKGSWNDAGCGFADLQETYTGVENPFCMGSARQTKAISHSSKTGYASIEWRPEIPSRGEYAVYVSYKSLPNCSTSAHYTVSHMGGKSSFAVNQKIGGGTWIYLGTFEFAEGTEGAVTLDNRTPEGWRYNSESVVTADAVRFGGGMGNIARGEIKDTCGTIISDPYVSGMPRSAEAARYWLQWAGVDSTIWHLNEGQSDYRDDFMSRGDWVAGIDIPSDLTLAFHSDAGVREGDGIVGTLAIYTLKNERTKKLPSGEDRLTNREYANLVQDQLINDLRADYDSLWSQRAIWDRGYRESRTPSSPALLLELLSHQNFADMKYGLDPSFRFTVSRAIYKGMLKYMSNRYGHEYVVQPLPVDHMGVRFADNDHRKAIISWRAVEDHLEPTAESKGYILYTRIDDGAFDNGKDIKEANLSGSGTIHYSVDIEPGHIYSYKIVAYNDGGQSFPSETVSIGTPSEYSKDETVLIVNNFDRISGPTFFDTPSVAGFNNQHDSGVPYMKDLAFVGEQHNFRRPQPWTDDDNPGFGSSYQDYAGKTVAGNTFDFAAVHGKAVLESGHAFHSCSNEAFFTDSTFRSGVWTLDLICGKQVTTSVGSGLQQKYTVFTSQMQDALEDFSSKGGNILVSGAYIGTDIADSIFPIHKDSAFVAKSTQFAADVLGYKWSADKASSTATLKAARNPLIDFSGLGVFGFYNKVNPDCYSVESPDGILPASETGKTLLRYTDTGISAGIGYEGEGYRTVCLGFPIEVLQNEEDIYKIINITLEFFKK